jgi:hypothetical protein
VFPIRGDRLGRLQVGVAVPSAAAGTRRSWLLSKIGANSAGTWRRTFAGTGTTSTATAYGDSVALK